jgi:hypothetical protein
VVEPPLDGDRDALYMAAPRAAGQGLGRLIPPGPVLECCCGVGGLTRGLAEGHAVTAVDRRLDRLRELGKNLRALGLAELVQAVCCDLSRPGLRKPPTPIFAACVLDPDWSPPGQPPRSWAKTLEEMQPPALSLARWALGFSARLALRLPPASAPGPLARLGPCRALPVLKGGRESFRFLLVGPWPAAPAALAA